MCSNKLKDHAETNPSNRDEFTIVFNIDSLHECPIQAQSQSYSQNDHKWDKSWIFSDHISVDFGSPSQNLLKYDLKNLSKPICTEI